MAHLLVIRGRDQGKKFDFDRKIEIGRDANNDLQLLDGEASRRHATLQIAESGQWQIVDHGSSNGTRVNDRTVQQSDIRNGDRIEIGSTLLVFTSVESKGADSWVAGSKRTGSRVTGTLESAFSTPSALRQSEPTDHGVEIITGVNERLGTPDVSRIVSRVSPSAAPMTSPDDGQIDIARSLEVMYHASLAVGRGEDLDEVLGRVLQLVFDWTEADRGCIMLRSEATGKMVPAARCDRGGSTSPSSEAEPISISRTILDYVLTSKQGVRTSDAQDDKRFDEAASILQARIREAICVPLQGRYGIVGALYIDTDLSPGQIIERNEATKFNDDHLRLMTAIGHQAAIAIEDTQHYSQLLQSERLAAMGQTIATLSHHIKNILQGIRGGSYLIQTGLDNSDDQAVRRGWGIVDRNQGRISNLVMDMLTYSKERTPQLDTGDLNETVTDVVNLLSSVAAERSVEMTCDCDRELPPAVFDADAMHRAVMNLVTNAIDAAADEATETSRVFVQTRFGDEGWFVEVADTGPGIAPEQRDKVFLLFESGKGTRGTGLGLPVCAKIMQEHGGRIDVIDPPDGHDGVVFRLVLPPIEHTSGETIMD